MCLTGSLYVRSLIEGMGTLPHVPTLCCRLGVCVLPPLFRPLPSLSPPNGKTTASRSQYLSLFSAGITFTRDGRYLALAERRDCRDYVSIFVCSDWQLLRVRHTPGVPGPWGGGGAEVRSWRSQKLFWVVWERQLHVFKGGCCLFPHGTHTGRCSQDPVRLHRLTGC